MQTSSFYPLRPLHDKRPLFFLNPYPQEVQPGNEIVDFRRLSFMVNGESALKNSLELLRAEMRAIGLKPPRSRTEATYFIALKIEDMKLKNEGYRLVIEKEKATISGQDGAGLFYGIQTFLQIIAFTKGEVPTLTIRDWPLYPIRCAMLDMGRGLYSLALIKRTIRIMSRLKLNMLHLHINDDQIMGMRFATMPLGKENPKALPMRALGEIVRYSREYHIAVCPEIESWGHTASITYHYPELHGAPGVYGGSSLAIGEKAFTTLTHIYDEVVPYLETESMFHLGLDEAQWALAPGEAHGANENPEWFVGKLYDILMSVGERHKKKLTMRVWADQGGRPIPSGIKQKVIVEPWAYFSCAGEAIKKNIADYTGESKSPFIMGGGMSSLHFGGGFGATGLWCEAGRHSSNCLGINICLWEGNLFEKYLVSLYGGAAYAWNVDNTLKPTDNDTFGEYLYGKVYSQMISWQTIFEDAREENILLDRGDAVYRGYYLTGVNAGKQVTPIRYAVKP